MDGAALIVIGVALLAISWTCWSGRWRAWSKIAMLPALPIAIGPFLGACLLLCGIGTLTGVEALYAPALLLGAVGLVLGLWSPGWYGPRWFRERSTEYDLSVPLNAAIASSVRSTPAQSSDAVARSHMGGREPDARWRAHLVSDEHGRPSAMQREGVVRGHLLLYPDALVFAADVREDRMRGSAVVEVVPAESIVAVRRVSAGSRPDGARSGPDLPSRVMPRVRIDTVEGAHVFETASAGRRVRELEERYLAAGQPV